MDEFWQRRRRSAAWIGSAIAVLGLVPLGILSEGAVAQVLQLNLQNEIVEAAFNSSATRYFDLQKINAEGQRDRKRIDELEDQVRRLEGSGGLAQTVASLRGELTAAQEKYMRDLAAKDADYARAIAAYRTNVSRLVALPGASDIFTHRRPGNLAASRRRLDAFVRQRQQSVPPGQFIEEMRSLAVIALDDRANGEASTQEVLTRFEELAKLAPADAGTQLQLSKLYLESGAGDAARAAALRAGDLAGNDWDRGSAFAEAAAIAANQGDFGGAAEAAKKSVAAWRGASKKGDLGALRNLSKTLFDMATVMLSRKDLGPARTALQDSADVVRQLVALNPTSRDTRRDLAHILRVTGELRAVSADLTGAAAPLAEARAVQEGLLTGEPRSEALLGDLYVTLSMQYFVEFTARGGASLAAASQASPEVAAAVAQRLGIDGSFAEKGAAIATRLLEVARLRASIDPKSDGYQRDLAAALNFAREVGVSPDATIKSLEEQRDAETKVATLDSGDAGARLRASQTVSNIRETYLLAGIGRMQRNDMTGAVRLLEEGLVHARQGLAKSPNSKDWNQLTADLLGDLANWSMLPSMMGGGGSPDARALTRSTNYRREEVKILEALTRQSPADLDLKSKLARAREELGQLTVATAMMSATSPGGAPAAPRTMPAPSGNIRQDIQLFRATHIIPAATQLGSNPGQARTQLVVALAEARKLAGNSPAPAWSEIIAELHNMLSLTATQQKDYPAAAKHKRDEVAVLIGLSAVAPDDRNLASKLNNAQRMVSQLDSAAGYAQQQKK